MLIRAILYFLIFITVLDVVLPEPIIGGRHLTDLRLNNYTNFAVQYPFMVSLQYAIKSKNRFMEYQHFCGGSLLTNNWILTAAHCVYKTDIRKVIAVIGQLNLTIAYSIAPHLAIDRVEFLNFQPMDYRNDIALVHLQQSYHSPFPLGMSLAKLPTRGMRAYREQPCKVIGYGAEHKGSEAKAVLSEAELYVVRNRYCRNKLGRVWGPQPGSNTFCALGKNLDSCQGDSGGPLLCQYKGRFLIYGLVSYGLSCGLNGIPSVYVATIPYLEHINRIIKS